VVFSKVLAPSTIELTLDFDSPIREHQSHGEGF